MSAVSQFLCKQRSCTFSFDDLHIFRDTAIISPL